MGIIQKADVVAWVDRQVGILDAELTKLNTAQASQTNVAVLSKLGGMEMGRLTTIRDLLRQVYDHEPENAPETHEGDVDQD